MGDRNIKQIIINPELFEFSGRKRKSQTPKKEKIKVASSSSSIENKTVSRNPKGKILKHIQNIYNQERKNKKEQISSSILNPTDKFNNELDESINYLLGMSSAVAAVPPTTATTSMTPEFSITPAPLTYSVLTPQQPTPLVSGGGGGQINKTIKRYSYPHPEYDTSGLTPITIATTSSSHHQHHEHHTPSYGCLKNGVLPTFKKLNKTVKNPRDMTTSMPTAGTYGTSINVNPIINIGNGGGGGVGSEEPDGLNKFLNLAMPNASATTTTTTTPEPNLLEGEKGADDNASVGAAATTSTSPTTTFKRGFNKRKVIRRTFRLGKSRREPKIGVLISNKTIRNQISEKIKDIYQVPISDIKQFLLKKGLIRVGTTAPNDVLREMYKNVVMLCGDLQNHNTENVLYNYMNQK